MRIYVKVYGVISTKFVIQLSENIDMRNLPQLFAYANTVIPENIIILLII